MQLNGKEFKEKRIIFPYGNVLGYSNLDTTLCSCDKIIALLFCTRCLQLSRVVTTLHDGWEVVEKVELHSKNKC